MLIVNAAIGGHYPRGQARLIRSLHDVGYSGEICAMQRWPDGLGRVSSIYDIKAACLEAVLRTTAARIVIWMDCTAVAVRPLDALVQRIRERGYYLASSGYSAAQTCTDRQLEAAGVTRDQAVGIPDSATGCVGVDMHDGIGGAFMGQWLDWSRRGLFAGTRGYDPSDSTDPRFMFGRQDQSAATLIAHGLGMTLDHLGGLTSYWPPSETAVMAYKGIQ